MKAKFYNSETVVRTHISNQPPTLFLNKYGQIRINKPLCEGMHLSEGDTIQFIQDEDKPEDWYLHKSDKGFILRGDKTSKYLGFNCAPLIHDIVKSLGFQLIGSSRILVTLEPLNEDGMKLFPIITHSIKDTTKKPNAKKTVDKFRGGGGSHD